MNARRAGSPRSRHLARAERQHRPVRVAVRGAAELLEHGLVTLQFVDHYEEPTDVYPLNPNGSPLGLGGICSDDGRVTAVMPHPERVFRSVQNSWSPREWGEDGGWLRLFRNARVFLA